MLIDDLGAGRPHSRRIFAVLLAAAVPLAGCVPMPHTIEQPKPEDPRQSELLPAASYNARARDAIKDGGSLATAMDSWPGQFNPFHIDATANSQEVWAWYGPQLVLRDWKGQWHFNSEYLDNVEAEERDGHTVVTYTFNRNARFSDGTDLDWESFYATWQANNGNDAAYHSAATSLYSRIVSVAAGASHNQAVVTFAGANENWQRYFPTVLHPAVDTPTEFNDGFVDALPAAWGSGPFQLDMVDADAQTVLLNRSDNWWGEPAKLNQRRFIQLDAADMLTAFRRGTIDTLDVSIRERMSAARGIEGVDVRDGIATSRRLFLLDAQNGPLTDSRVRKAIFGAVDRKAILTSRYEGVPAALEPPQSILYFPWQNGFKDNLSAELSFDVSQANSVLDDAGWKRGSDGYRHKNGQRLELTIPATDRTDSARAAQKILQEQLREIGVSLELVDRAGDDALQLFGKKDAGKTFNAALVIAPAPYADGIADLQEYVSPQGLLARTGVEDDSLAQQVAELSTAADVQTKLDRANHAEQALFAHATVLPMSFYPGEMAVKRGLSNFGPAAFAQLPVQDIGWEL